MRGLRSAGIVVFVSLFAGTFATAARAASASYFTSLGLGAMSTGRQGAAVTPLPDGKVLIAGGFNGSYLSSAELFDPQTGTFSSAGLRTMPTAREGAVSVALPDGDVLIAGGSAGSGPIASALLFVPSTGQFSSAGLGSMNVPRFGAAAASLPHGKVLIVGGMDATRPLATAEVFDPKTGTFTPTAGTMSESRWLPVAASLPNGEVLVAGGLSLRNGGTVLSSAELYDPKTQRFSKAHLGSMTTPREAAVAVSLADGRVLIAGGIARNTFLSSAELFDPASGNFSNAGVGAMSVPRLGAGAAPLSDGRVLIAGGTPDEITRLASAEVFESAPEAQSAPVSFGHVTRGVRSATQTLVVQNVGAQALRISSASVRGGAAGDFAIRRDACAGRRLAFGQSCTVTIRFRPQAAGLRKANIRLRDNERVQTRIRVSGVGIR